MNEQTSSGAARLHTIDALRGVAALAVCWFHFTAVAPRDVIPSGLLRTSGTYGHLGVDVFFVISGFVIPYALLRSGYALTDLGRFIGRRILRLEPAYVCAIGATLLLDYLSSFAPTFRGQAFHIVPLQVLAHLTYTTAFTSYSWLNAIFWTLAIEFQFYLLMGFVFPLIARKNVALSLSVLAVLATSAFVFRWDALATHYMPLFTLGIATFQYRTERLSRNIYSVVLTAAFAAAYWSLGMPQAIAGVAAAAVIAWVQIRSRVLLYFGTISYSLYLLHTQIGSRVLNLSIRFHVPASAKIVVVIAALTAATLSAHVFHRLIETSGHRWAARIRYRGRGGMAFTPTMTAAAESRSV